MAEAERTGQDLPRTKVELRHVYKIFGDRVDDAIELVNRGAKKDAIFAETNATVGVNDATFEIREGEIFVVMGLSGSGKSTLLRLINRLIEPTMGEILVDGKDVTKMSKRELIALRRRDMSMVFQSFALLPNRTVLDNAAFGLEVAGVSREEREGKALAALDAVGLKANARSRPDELSGGMKQRVGLARALASEPTILLMDEAFSALDPLIRTEMQDELVRLQTESRRTVIFVSHDLDEAIRIGDRIAIMQGGSVVQVGTPEEIVLEPANDYVRSFFKNVDVAQVFRSAHVARTDEAPVIGPGQGDVTAAVAEVVEGPAEVAVVVDAQDRLQGLATPAALAGMPEGASPADVPTQAVEPIRADTPLTDVMRRVAEEPLPVPVVDEDGRYLGTISKSSLLATLDRAG
ncbi:glycine betaine/L-proline ABC transporter ATP-binding protein ProV [Lutibaculum baratangense]|uniref:Quaternary amine transport ATP-binding protein n=1 Tax=Lutibaculum baratangense AMV1 TaxID=631454 RepID=V4RRH0_9HYPH|nr:glycine betaine/L-proline ABC transporter ATP-binding protein ProV [Lutibaculum baratangense]ESR25740.1 L-proline glycine betaine ABC transport system permease protein ProV [Lutibaculum baratangense AMV1]